MKQSDPDEHDGWQSIRLRRVEARVVTARTPQRMPTVERPRTPDDGSLAHIWVGEDDPSVRDALVFHFLAAGADVTLLTDATLLRHLAVPRSTEEAVDLLVLELPMLVRLSANPEARLRVSDLPILVVTLPGSSAASVLTQVDRALAHVALLTPKAGDPDDTTLEGSIPACRSCGSTEHLVLDPTRAAIPFCRECWDHARPPGPYDDVGGEGDVGCAA